MFRTLFGQIQHYYSNVNAAWYAAKRGLFIVIGQLGSSCTGSVGIVWVSFSIHDVQQ